MNLFWEAEYEAANWELEQLLDQWPQQAERTRTLLAAFEEFFDRALATGPRRCPRAWPRGRLLKRDERGPGPTPRTPRWPGNTCSTWPKRKWPWQPGKTRRIQDSPPPTAANRYLGLA